MLNANLNQKSIQGAKVKSIETQNNLSRIFTSTKNEKICARKYRILWLNPQFLKLTKTRQKWLKVNFQKFSNDWAPSDSILQFHQLKKMLCCH